MQIRAKARERQLGTLKQNDTVRQNSAQREEGGIEIWRQYQSQKLKGYQIVS
jgi:hypothetical protein